MGVVAVDKFVFFQLPIHDYLALWKIGSFFYEGVVFFSPEEQLRERISLAEESLKSLRENLVILLTL